MNVQDLRTGACVCARHDDVGLFSSAVCYARPIPTRLMALRRSELMLIIAVKRVTPDDYDQRCDVMVIVSSTRHEAPAVGWVCGEDLIDAGL